MEYAILFKKRVKTKPFLTFNNWYIKKKARLRAGLYKQEDEQENEVR